MRSLDDVIKALAFCQEGLCDDLCPFFEEDRHFCVDAKCCNALYYLEKYRNLLKNLSAEKEILPDPQDNPMLTWNDLLCMEGKPVWLEYDNSDRNCWVHRCWHIIRNFQVASYDGKDHHWMRVDIEDVYFDKDELGKTWIAYRKEN